MTEALVQVGALGKHGDLLASLDARNTPGLSGLDYIRAVNRVFHQLVEGVSPDKIEEAAELTAERSVEQIYPEMKQRIRDAKAEGPIIVISDGPDAFIQAFGRRIGAVASLGKSFEEYEADARGVRGIYGDKWAKLGRTAAASRLKLGEDTVLHRAFGDAKSDLPLLERAVYPCAVNPLDDVRRIAEERGWEILDCEGLLPWGDLSGRLIQN